MRRAIGLPNLHKTGHEKHLWVYDFEQAFDSLEGFKFWTVVRNPFDRIRSMWKYRLRLGKHNLDFEDYLRKKANSKLGHNHRPQSECIANKEGRPHIHWLIHFENFSEGLRVFGEKIGVPDLAQNRPQTNVNTYENSLVDAYTDEMMEIVRTRYASDFEMFGYNPDSLTDLSHDPSRAQIRTLPW